MSVGHTPGPWLLSGATVYALDETGTCNRFSVRPDGGWTYRSPGSLGSTGDRTTEAELEANARLIASAPDLLEALERLARDADQWSGQVEPPLPSLAYAWDVIARAKGAA